MKQRLKQRENVKKEKEKIKRENNTRLLKKKLDQIFSEYIRRKAANKDGKIVCVCCGAMLDWQKAQNMHYISRSCMALRYDERNCYAGCMRCNVLMHGNYPAYTDYILSTYGVERLKWLLDMKHEIKQWQADELKEMIKFYREKLSTLSS